MKYETLETNPHVPSDTLKAESDLSLTRELLGPTSFRTDCNVAPTRTGKCSCNYNPATDGRPLGRTVVPIHLLVFFLGAFSTALLVSERQSYNWQVVS